MEVNSNQGSEVKEEIVSDDDITVLDEDEEEEFEGSSSKQNEKSLKEPLREGIPDGAGLPEVGLHGSGEAEADHQEQDANSASESHAVMPPFPITLDHSLDQSWLWNRDSEVQNSTSEMQGTQRNGARVRRFQCGICSTNFTLLKNAKRHYRCQHLNYFYWCKYCPNGKTTRRYTRREFLEDHFLSQHPDIICEVSEANKTIPTEMYNIISVNIWEDDEVNEEGGVEMVTTSDSSNHNRSIFFEDTCSSEDVLDSAISSQNGESVTPRGVDVPCGQYINLADYHGLVNEPESLASLKRSQQSTHCEPNKKRRNETNQTGLMENDGLSSENMLSNRDEGSGRNRMVSQTECTGSTSGLTVNQGGCATSSYSIKANNSDNPHLVEDDQCIPVSMRPTSSAIAQDCLIIGSAIPQPLKCDKITESDTATTRSLPSGRAAYKSVSQRSQQVPGMSSSTSHIQAPVTSRAACHQSKKQSSATRFTHSGQARDKSRNMIQERSIVNSSSDAGCQGQERDMSQQCRSKEVVFIKEGGPTSSHLTCKEVFDKYHNSINKYIKEIDYKYDSCGKVLRNKTVRHVFVFHNSKERTLEDGNREANSSERSASR